MLVIKFFSITALMFQSVFLSSDLILASSLKNVDSERAANRESKRIIPHNNSIQMQVNQNERDISSQVALDVASASALFVVITESWNDKVGIGSIFKKDGDKWFRSSSSISVALGRSGLGWGIGVADFRQIGGINKREGDGRSPAGVFRLPQAFGSVAFGQFPFLEVSNQTICVDDSQSASYNKIIDMNSRQRDWNSFEKMAISAYELGIEVAHNPEISQPQGGSCIFIHLASETLSATAGCTAMSKDNLKLLLSELDNESLLIQMPRLYLQKFLPDVARSMFRDPY